MGYHSLPERMGICMLPSSLGSSSPREIRVTTCARIASLTLLVLSASVLAQPKADPKIVHGPRIGLVTATDATVYWDTDQSATGQVSWGTTQNYGSSAAETTPTTAHRVTITGLSPGTTYHYRVATGATTSADNTFSSAAPADQAFRYLFMADNRGKTTAEDLKGLPPPFLSIIKLSVAMKPAFTLHGGDIFHGMWDANAGLYNNFKVATDPLASIAPFLITPGNHEMSEAGGVPPGQDPLAVFNQQFAQPTGPDPLNLITAHYPGSVYSFDWGNSHFASLDNCRYDSSLPDNGMYRVSPEEISWLKRDLQDAQSRGARHLFVFAHANAFSDSSTTGPSDPDEGTGGGLVGNSEIRDALWQVLIDYGVDAYLCGHVHEFNDEWGQKSDTKFNNTSVIHWMNGNSGCVVDANDNYVPGTNEFTLLSVTGDRVTADLYNDLGNPVYRRIFQSTQPSTFISKTSPVPNAIDAAVKGAITATFKSAPAAGTTFTVTGTANVPIPGTVAFDGNTATFTPSRDLPNSETQTATIKTPSGGAFSWSFTTVSASSTSPMALSGNGEITIDTSQNSQTQIYNVNILPDSDPSFNQAGKPAGYSFPDGIAFHRVSGVTNGATIKLAVTFPSDIPQGSRIYKVGTNGFYEYTKVSISGKTVTLTLTDGGDGDRDGVADGRISNTVGVAIPVDSAQLVLSGGKVGVRVTWKSQYTGQSGTAAAIGKGDAYGYFLFSDPRNPEVFVKVLDYGASQPYLLFWAGLTDFEYTVTFTNLATGKSFSATKPAGSTDGGASTTALAHVRAVRWDPESGTTTDVAPGESLGIEPHVRRLLGPRSKGDEDNAWAGLPQATSDLLLSNGQVSVSVAWKSQYSGQSGVATPLPQDDQFGFFYFSDAGNPEVFVKVLDWGSSNPFLLFAAGLTDFQYTVTFTNIKTGQKVTFPKAAGGYAGYADGKTMLH